MRPAECGSRPSASMTGAMASRSPPSIASSRKSDVPNDNRVAYRIIDRSAEHVRDERAEVIAGLIASPASIAPKFFYDELGCALYGAICRLPESSPTRIERKTFRELRVQIAPSIAKARHFVDPG